jgi:hypothetical protein
VLDFTYPELFGDVIEAVRPVMDMWGLLFRALGPSECFGIAGFTAKWVLRVVGLPAVLGLGILLYWIYDRHASGAEKANFNAKSHVFFAVFFSYPTICTVSFAAFICRDLSPTTSVLEADDSVFCEDSGHQTLQALSGVVVAVVAFGLPALFGAVMIWAARSYDRETADRERVATAQRISTELKVDLTAVEYVMRDITIGRDYSFLMDAYKPRYLYWEALDMLRKLALVGVVLLVGRGTVAQLSVALVLSFGFFALHMKTWPYKIDQVRLCFCFFTD